MEEENASYFEESVYSNQEDRRRREAADRRRQEEEDRRHQEQDLERQRQEEENRRRQEQDLERQRQEEENRRRQEQDGPTLEKCAMFRILYSKFLGQKDNYLDTILDSEEKLNEFNAMYAKTFYGREEQFMEYINLQKEMYDAHMLEWRDLRENAVKFFMAIDSDGMEKCLKDAKEYVEKNKGSQLSHGDGMRKKEEYEKRQKEKRSLLFNSPDLPNDPAARREYEHNNRFTYQALVIKNRSSDQAKLIRTTKKDDIMKQRRGMKSNSSVGENVTSNRVTRSRSLNRSVTGAKTSEEAFQEIQKEAKKAAAEVVHNKNRRDSSE